MLKFYLLILITILMMSCNHREGHLGTNSSIDGAKKRGVFIYELTSVPNPYIVNDSIVIHVNEAWIENKWRYGNEQEEIILESGYYLRINTFEQDIKGVLDLSWAIGLEGSHSLRQSSINSLIGDFENLPIDDTIKYFVQKGCNMKRMKKKERIGDLELIKIP